MQVNVNRSPRRVGHASSDGLTDGVRGSYSRRRRGEKISTSELIHSETQFRGIVAHVTENALGKSLTASSLGLRFALDAIVICYCLRKVTRHQVHRCSS